LTYEEALSKLDKTFIGNLEWKIMLSKALEKQIPKRPMINVDELFSTRVVSFSCPNHNCTNDNLGNNKYRFDCCEVCGQRLDWSVDHD
jgi:hypothetical protein